jgi:hypothetical protein
MITGPEYHGAYSTATRAQFWLRQNSRLCPPPYLAVLAKGRTYRGASVREMGGDQLPRAGAEYGKFSQLPTGCIAGKPVTSATLSAIVGRGRKRMPFSAVDFLQALTAGILVGSAYALMCIGLGIIFGSMNVINCRHRLVMTVNRK